MSTVGLELLFEENLGGIWPSGIVERNHDLSLLGAIGEWVPAILIGHIDIRDSDAGVVVKAGKDSWFLKSKPSRNARRDGRKYSHQSQHDEPPHDCNDIKRTLVHQSELLFLRTIGKLLFSHSSSTRGP